MTLISLCVCESLSHVQLFVTPWTIACQTPLSIALNTGVGCHLFFQGIFPTQGSNLGLLHFGQIPYHLSQQGSFLISFIVFLI